MSLASVSAPAILGPFVAWEGAFGAAEIDAIIQYADGIVMVFLLT